MQHFTPNVKLGIKCQFTKASVTIFKILPISLNYGKFCQSVEHQRFKTKIQHTSHKMIPFRKWVFSTKSLKDEGFETKCFLSSPIRFPDATECERWSSHVEIVFLHIETTPNQIWLQIFRCETLLCSTSYQSIEPSHVELNLHKSILPSTGRNPYPHIERLIWLHNETDFAISKPNQC